MSDNITYKFCIDSLRYVYHIIGYDNILKELNFIRHLDSHNNANILQEKQTINTINKIEQINEVIIPDTVETLSENKNIIIQPNSKYTRTIISDEERCETILSTGKRCTLRKAENCVNCSRHTK